MPKAISRRTFKQVILELLPLGHPIIENAAHKIGMPVRTLQRRLQDAGLTYSELVDEVRYSTACRLLKNKHRTIADIGTALGFTDPSNFRRAFQRWSGMSPSEFREKHVHQVGRRGTRRSQSRGN